jgi:hypothetical protein
MSNHAELIVQLKTLLPLIKEKETAGLIPTSYEKANSLIRWYERYGTITEKQALLVGRIIHRANRKHRNASITIAAEKVDEQSIINKVVERIGNISVDQKVIIEQVMKQMDERRPREVKIILAADAKDKGRELKGPVHKQFQHLIRLAQIRVQGIVPGIFLSGEASSGKTTGARMLAEALGLKWHFNGAISFPHEMLGFKDGNGVYHRTPFREAYEHGGVYTFDEVDRSDPVALLAVNPHLANGVATFPDGQIKRHKNCIIVCTANTWGLGGDGNYSGATKLDGAFLSRFPSRLSWDIDPVLEDAIVSNKEWLARVRRARAKARDAGLKVFIDVRISLAGEQMIAAGYTSDEAAAMTYLTNLKPEQKAQLQ